MLEKSSITTNNPIHADGLLRISQIIGDRKRGIPGILPIGKSSFWQGVKNGVYPAPVKLGPRTTCWKAGDILALVSQGTKW